MEDFTTYKVRTMEHFYCKNKDLVDVLQDIKIQYGRYKTYLIKIGGYVPITNKVRIIVIGYKRHKNEFKLIVNYYKKVI